MVNNENPGIVPPQQEEYIRLTKRITDGFFAYLKKFTSYFNGWNFSKERFMKALDHALRESETAIIMDEFGLSLSEQEKEPTLNALNSAFNQLKRFVAAITNSATDELTVLKNFFSNAFFQALEDFNLRKTQMNEKEEAVLE